jgi:hypothetical protein
VTVAHWRGSTRRAPWSPDGAQLLYLSPRGLGSCPGRCRGCSRAVTRLQARLGCMDARWRRDRLQQRGHPLPPRPERRCPTRPGSGGQAHSPAWSPDGKWIAYVRNVSTRRWRTWLPARSGVVRATGGDPIRSRRSPAHASRSGCRMPPCSRVGSGRQAGRLPSDSRARAPDGAPVRLTAGCIRTRSASRPIGGAGHACTGTANVVAITQPGRSVSLGTQAGHHRLAGDRGSRYRRTGAVSSTPTATAIRTSGGCRSTAARRSRSRGPGGRVPPAYSPDGKFVMFMPFG